MSGRPRGKGRSREFRLEVAGRDFVFETQPGVFSADGVDPGTALLLESVAAAVKPHQRILDLGTGVGVIGILLSSLVTRGEVWMVDVDIRSVRLAVRNSQRNGVDNVHVLLSDITVDLPDTLRFDLVVSNPPTHDGREVLEAFVEQSYRVLRRRGALWVVVNRMLSIRDMMTRRFGDCEACARHKGFVVLRSHK